MKGKYPFQSLKLSIAALCEYALESRGRWTLVGTFRQLEFREFPATLDRLEVYLLFTDVTDPDIQSTQVSLWASEDPEGYEANNPFFQGNSELVRLSYPGGYEAVHRFTGVEFPKPGRYDVFIEVDHEVFELISIFVRMAR